MNIARVVRYIVKVRGQEVVAGICGVGGGAGSKAPDVTNDEICLEIVRSNITKGTIPLEDLLEVEVELYFIKDEVEEGELKGVLDGVLQGIQAPLNSVSEHRQTAPSAGACKVGGSEGPLGFAPLTDAEFAKQCGIDLEGVKL